MRAHALEATSSSGCCPEWNQKNEKCLGISETLMQLLEAKRTFSDRLRANINANGFWIRSITLFRSSANCGVTCGAAAVYYVSEYGHKEEDSCNQFKV
jgi:hypothetical protein